MVEAGNETIGAIVLRLLREARHRHRMTMEELADRAGVHRTYIGLLERGERQPTIEVAVRLADALNVRLSNVIEQAEDLVAVTVGFTRVTASSREVEIVPSPTKRVVRREHFGSESMQDFHRTTAFDVETLALAIESAYHTLDLIDEQLLSRESPPIRHLVELANLSSMLGNLLSGGLAIVSNGLYQRNRPHAYPDLLSQDDSLPNIELKIALEGNMPKGHHAKAGMYITFRYVLVSRAGVYVRGKDNRGEVPTIWEIKWGSLAESDFSLSNTAGDSGKTAVIKSSSFTAMNLLYYDPELSPYSRSRYPK
ncbi:MAG: helix-turn-helix domain-containing protein [Thermomicrobiales bacterium]